MDRNRDRWAILLILMIIVCGCGEEEDQGSTLTLQDGTVLEGVPAWYTDNLDSDDTLYARGTGVAADMIRAHTIAKNQAYQTIERVYEYTRAELEVLPRGTVREHFILVREGSRVRAYILIKIPYEGLR